MFIKEESFGNKKNKFTQHAEKLTSYIRENIPVLQSLDIKVISLKESEIKISAPLYENRNHYGSAFGGSIATVGIVAGWAILQYKIFEEELPAKLVIQQSNTKYLSAVMEDFHAHTVINPDEWASFKESFYSKGKARLKVTTQIVSGGKIAAKQEGLYVALQSRNNKNDF